MLEILNTALVTTDKFRPRTQAQKLLVLKI
jgi:hypothetical protein